jgi:hypothetical protein
MPKPDLLSSLLEKATFAKKIVAKNIRKKRKDHPLKNFLSEVKIQIICCIPNCYKRTRNLILWLHLSLCTVAFAFAFSTFFLREPRQQKSNKLSRKLRIRIQPLFGWILVPDPDQDHFGPDFDSGSESESVDLHLQIRIPLLP